MWYRHGAITAAALSLAALGTLAITGLASAADMPLKAPPPPPPQVFSWTGFYFGGHVGGAWDSDQWQFLPANTFTHNHADSMFGGFQGGYNYQISRFVVGVEGDVSATDLVGTDPCPNRFFTCSHNMEWLASLRGRVGMLATDQALFYVTGGAGFSDIHHSASPPGVAPFAFSGNFSDTRIGPTLGGGLEYAFTTNWSVKFEYLHYWFDSSTAPPGTLSGANSTKLTNYVDTAQIGLNYKFSIGGPVVAKY
jgi:outer membrane immunogenic protein